MFVGQYSHLLDDKGRLIIPSKYRDELGKKFYLVIGYDPCLYVYDEAEFAKFEQSSANIDEKSKGNRDIRRYLLSTASEAELDKTGRVLIPDWLRNLTNIRPGCDCIIAGVGEKLEVWDKDTWNEKFSADRMKEIRDYLYDRETDQPGATGAAKPSEEQTGDGVQT